MKHSSEKQFWFAVALMIFGGGLLVAGFIVSPSGVIDPSVLTAFGEIATFSGTVLGIDYSYKKSYVKRINDIKELRDEEA